MCGIAGFLNLKEKKNQDLDALKRMTDAIAHRGPDGEGIYSNDKVCLGHRRLSIIDLIGGSQPILNLDRSIILVFNGEIYNYIELRIELQKLDYKFTTKSDSEVLLVAYEHWGIDCLSHLNGCWSFALWDDRNEQLLLSRDRIGEKPLFYSVFENTLIFGSEIKSLFAWGIKKEPDLEMTELYLSLSFIPSPHTFFKNVKKLKPGHNLLIKEGTIRDFCYWDVPRIEENKMLKNNNEIESNFKSLLSDSVKMRMRSDVPFGAFLSGGLDSSTIVSLMSEESLFPIETFNVGFLDERFDERILARSIAQKYSTTHHEFLFDINSIDKYIDQTLSTFDEPFGDASSIVTGFVAKQARKYVKMALSGDGGDEVLSGYTAYQGEKVSEFYNLIPFPLRYLTQNTIHILNLISSGHYKTRISRFENLLSISNKSFNQRLKNKASWVKTIDIHELMPNNVYTIDDYLSDFYKDYNLTSNFYKLMYFHIKVSLPDQMLVKVDRTSMFNGLEVRVPFIDHRLIEYMMNVSANIKMPFLRRKNILKAAYGNKLPNQVLTAPKKGFNLPLNNYFRENSNSNHYFKHKLTAEIINEKLVDEIFHSNFNGKSEYGNFLWLLLLLSRTV